MSEAEVLLQEKKNGIGTLVLNRPEQKNALSIDLLMHLHFILKEWAKDDAVRVVVITGAGDTAFSSGFDILSIPTETSPGMKETMKDENPLELALSAIRDFPYPTIAKMNGYAFGAGLNLAVCCDIRIGVDDMKAGMPPAKLGVVYPPDGLKQFIEVAGMACTRELFLTGRTYRGEQLREMGLVNHLVPRADLADTVEGLASEIASNAPLSLKGIKRILNLLGEGTPLSGNAEKEAVKIVTDALNSRDLKEGQAAFIEKRKPLFEGR